MRSQGLQHLARCFEMRGRVVVASDRDHRATTLAEQLGQEVVILRRCGLWRVGRVEDISGDDQQIHHLLPDRLQEKLQEPGVLRRPRVLPEHFAQMPVCGVQHAVGSRRLGLD